MLKPHIITVGAAFLLASVLQAAEVRLGPEVPVSNVLEVGEEQIDPQLAFAPTGTFAVWSDRARYEVLGAFNGAQMIIDHTDGKDYIGWPAVAAGGRVFLVVWRHNVDQGQDQVLAQRFDFGGHPVDAQPIVLDVTARASFQQHHTAPSIAFDGTSFFVASTRGVGANPTATSNLLTIRIGEEGPPFGTRETPTASGFFDSGPRTARAFWTGVDFVVTFTVSHAAHAAGIYLFQTAGTMRFDRSNTLIDKTLPPILYNPGLKSFGLAATLTGSRLSYAWVDQVNDIQAAQSKLTGETTIAPRRVVRRSPTDRAFVVDMAWNGSEHVLVWLDGVDDTGAAAKVRAIRLDSELRAIDAEPFDISTQPGPLASIPFLVATPAGVTIAYSRYDAANAGAGRIFVCSLDALSPGSLPDLTINGTVTVTPNPAHAGETVTVKYQIRNQGGGAAGATTTRVTIKPSFGVVVLPSVERDFSTGSITAGAVVDETRELTLPVTATTGAYTVTVTLDSNDVVAQASKTNDSRSATLNVLAAPSCSFTLAPAEVSIPGAGGSGSIQVTVSDQSCQWTVSPERDDGWLTIRAIAGNGNGNGLILFTASQNPSRTASRAMTLLVGNTSAVVRQAPYVPHRRVVGR